jgi:hypothetical protein
VEPTIPAHADSPSPKSNPERAGMIAPESSQPLLGDKIPTTGAEHAARRDRRQATAGRPPACTSPGRSTSSRRIPVGAEHRRLLLSRARPRRRVGFVAHCRPPGEGPPRGRRSVRFRDPAARPCPRIHQLGKFDPRTHLSNRVEPGMSLAAAYVGLGVTTLDIPVRSAPDARGPIQRPAPLPR